MALLAMPVELVGSIVSYLEPRDVGALRTTCKHARSLCHKAFQTNLNRRRTTYCWETLERLQDTFSSQYSEEIHTLNLTLPNPPSRSISSLLPLAGMLVASESDLQRFGCLAALLASTFTSAARLRRLAIEASPGSETFTLRHTVPFSILRPTTASSSSTVGFDLGRCFTSVISAIVASRTLLEELSVWVSAEDPASNVPRAGLPLAALEVPSIAAERLTESLDRLERLQLTVEAFAEDVYLTRRAALQLLPGFVAHARHLRILMLAFRYSHAWETNQEDFFDAFANGVDLPMLQTFVLSHAHVSAHALSTFFLRQERLQCVTFYRTILLREHWSQVTDGLGLRKLNVDHCWEAWSRSHSFLQSPHFCKRCSLKGLVVLEED